MLVQFTVKVGGKEVGTVERELSGSAAQMEEELRETQQRAGRMVMERVLERGGGARHDGHQSHRTQRQLAPLPEFPDTIHLNNHQPADAPAATNNRTDILAFVHRR